MLKKYFAGLALFGLVTSAQAITPEEALKIVPAECNLVVRADLQKIIKHKPIADYVEMFTQGMEENAWQNPLTNTGIDLLQVEQVVVGVKFFKKGERRVDATPYFILTSKVKIDLAAAQKIYKAPAMPDWGGNMFNFTYKKIEVAGLTVFQLKRRDADDNPMCYIQLDDNSVIMLQHQSIEGFAALQKDKKKSLDNNAKLKKQLLKNKDAVWVSYKPGEAEKTSWKTDDSPVDVDAIKGLMAAIKLEEAGQLLQAQLFCSNEDAPQQLSTLINLFGPQAMSYCTLPAENLQSSATGKLLSLSMQMKKLDFFAGMRNYQVEKLQERNRAMMPIEVPATPARRAVNREAIADDAKVEEIIEEAKKADDKKAVEKSTR